ncbi:MAG: hypothetical protein U9N57_01390 [Pseudomonadota bacterium]|nr:hypothetical protein [Pseudomonadota bacterium]
MRKKHIQVLHTLVRSRKKIKKVKSVVHDNWEGGKTLPHKETEHPEKMMADIDQDDTLHDVSDGLDGVSFDYHA